MESNEPRLSKSSINCYEGCPHRWKLNHIDKLKEKMGPALFNGIKVHNLCEKFYKGNTTLDEGLDWLGAQDYAKEHPEKFKNFVKFNRNIADGELIFKPMMNETRFKNAEYNLSGVVDVVFKDDKGDIIILDWKTGKNRGVGNHRFELALYYLLIKGSHPELNITHWGIFFLDTEREEGETDEKFEKRTFAKEPVNLKEVDKAILKVQNTRKRINLKEFPKKGKYCNWCGYLGNGCEGI